MIKIQHHFDRFQRTAIGVFYYILRIALSLGLGFLTSKCIIFENFSPFSLILLSVSSGIGLIPSFCYLGSAFGFLAGYFNLSVFKYVTALTMVYVIYMVFGKTMGLLKKDTAIITAGCCFVSGFLFLLVGQLTLFNVLVLISECILIFCCIYFISYATRAFKTSCYLSSRELIAASITMILILVSLHNIYIFGMSVARILAFVLLFLALSCLKISHTAVLGTSLGIILSAVANGGEAVFTAVIVGTLVGCVFSSFSDRFAVTSYLIVYYAILLFFGNFPWNYWYFAEPLIAYGFVFFVPKSKMRNFLSSYIAVKTPKNSKKIKKAEKDIFEACRRECVNICPKAAICYEKNAPELKDALDALSEQFCQTEELGKAEDAIPFCIKPNAMAHIIEGRLVHNHSKDFEELVEELNRLSKKIEMKMNTTLGTVRFLSEEENKIKKSLEKRRICVKDISFIVDEQGKRKCDIQFEILGDLLVEKIIKETVIPYFDDELMVKISECDGLYIAHIRERNQYEISCAALCKTKNGEQISGDTALGFSAGKDFYYLLLADGMGSGKEAGLQSELVIDTVRRLVAGGLSVPGALNIYRSASRFRQDHAFATIDVCEINLNKGTADFYKAGAYDSYHIKDGHVVCVNGGGMPLGLMEHDRLKHTTVKVSDGDYLILSSDGLSVLGDSTGNVILECKEENVQLFARKILEKIATKADGGNDDATVMVCKFHKKEG